MFSRSSQSATKRVSKQSFLCKIHKFCSQLAVIRGIRCRSQLCRWLQAQNCNTLIGCFWRRAGLPRQLLCKTVNYRGQTRQNWPFGVCVRKRQPCKRWLLQIWHSWSNRRFSLDWPCDLRNLHNPASLPFLCTIDLCMNIVNHLRRPKLLQVLRWWKAAPLYWYYIIILSYLILIYFN